MITCSKCNGLGTIPSEWSGRDNTCDQCGGDGQFAEAGELEAANAAIALLRAELETCKGEKTRLEAKLNALKKHLESCP